VPQKVRNIAAAQKVFQEFSRTIPERWLESNAPTAWTNEALAKWEQQVQRVADQTAHTEGYEKAEVTAGGVDTNELSSKSMRQESSGLFFIAKS